MGSRRKRLTVNIWETRKQERGNETVPLRYQRGKAQRLLLQAERKRRPSFLREVSLNVILFMSNSKGSPLSYTLCPVAGTHHLGLLLCDDPQSLAASGVHLLGDRKHLPGTKKSQVRSQIFLRQSMKR